MTTSTPDPLTLRARTPEDLLAMVPVVLGFEPRESVTMLCFSAATRFHARLDLPPPEAYDEAVGVLVDPVAAHQVTSVALVLHSEEPGAADRFGRVLERALRRVGVLVAEALVADGRRWWRLGERGRGCGTAYDVSSHPFVLQAILRGDVVHRSREDLAASLDPDEAVLARVEAECERLRCVDVDEGLRWALAVVRKRVGDGSEPTDAEVAHLLVCLSAPDAVAAAVALVQRPADAHARFWISVLRRTPADLRLVPASVLALSAWLSGNGALAWCALDRVPALAAGDGLARAVRTALERAVPPETWWRHDTGDPA